MADVTQRCLAWARGQLKVRDDASPADLRAAFWAQLDGKGLVPSDQQWAAFRYLQAVAKGEPASDRPEEFRQAEEKRLDEEVEQFARQMFGLPPDDRKRRWEELHRQCQGTVRPLVRCESLAPGLDADLSEINPGQEDAVALARSLCDMLRASPLKRGPWRQRIRGLWNGNTARVRRAGKALRRYPQLTALDPTLIQELVDAPRLERTFARDVARSDETRQGQDAGTGNRTPAEEISLLAFLAFVLICGAVCLFGKGGTPGDRQERRSSLDYDPRANEIRRQLDKEILEKSLESSETPAPVRGVIEEMLNSPEYGEEFRAVLERYKNSASPPTTDAEEKPKNDNPSLQAGLQDPQEMQEKNDGTAHVVGQP